MRGWSRERVVRRSYRWKAGPPGTLLRPMGAQGWRVVPPPAAQEEVVKQVHAEGGHFGRRRTTYMVMLTHWWPGLYQAVRDCVQQCQQCHQVRAIFNVQRPEVQPLPISCMCYRWHMDLFGLCQVHCGRILFRLWYLDFGCPACGEGLRATFGHEPVNPGLFGTGVVCALAVP